VSRVHNKPFYFDYRKKLRNHSTASEATLWKLLKDKNIGGLKFRRQHTIGNYIVDFYCYEIRLIIELDGASHDNYLAEERDLIRDEYLRTLDYTILRFENRYVYEFPDEIISSILNHQKNFSGKL